MNIDELFKKLPGAFKADAAQGMDVTIQFNISEPRHVVIKDSKLTVNSGTAPSPSLAMNIADSDLVGMMTGTIEGMTLFMTGKLTIDGDMMLAQRMGGIFDQSKLSA